MALEEMRSRLKNDPDECDSVNRVYLGTIHSFCLDLIQSRGHLVGLRKGVSLIEKNTDRMAILREIMLNDPGYSSILRGQEKPTTFLSSYLSSISEQKRGLILPEASNETAPFPIIYRKYNDALMSQNAIDFDDILLFAYRILAENLDVVRLYNSLYRYICIDEAQDLNEVQYRVLQALCGTNFRNIMMVGDENQSIYAFNGSSSRYMSECFVRDFSLKIYTLDENFRSAKQIIEYANSLTTNKEDISSYYYDGELKISNFENETKEAKYVINTIEHLKLNGHKDIEGEVTYNKIAIIARNKYVLSSVESELTQANIPFYIKQPHSGVACETDFLKAFDLILSLIVNPMDLYHKQLLCKLTKQKMSDALCEKSASYAIEQLHSESDFDWLIDVLQGISPDSTVNFDNVLKALKDQIPATLSDEDKYLLEKDIAEWSNHWKRFKARVSSENRTLVSFRRAIALGKTHDLDGNLGVGLLTAHMSKGLEFEAVFVIGLTEGTFPDYRAIRSNGDAIVQEKNNMYVAATRAKRLCYLSYPQIKKMPWGDFKQQQPSRFIASYKNGNIFPSLY
jgi:DNA helicase-2/ATP-dependent DNA helicase PcrA